MANDIARAPGRRTLVEALEVAPGAAGAAPATSDAFAPGAQPDKQQPGTIPASAPGPAAPTSATLSPAAVAAAIQYHTSQPWKYTRSVITDIQNAVGVTATGVMNAETVQAIAAKQVAVNADRNPTPPLKVDGKAGPRTLPILMPVGLATNGSIDTYTADIGGMKDELDKATPADRAKLLIAEINTRLAAVGVPAITKPVTLHSSLNIFIPSDWTMTMGLKTLADPKAAAATMYHEARHAEQAFRIARMLAGKKHSDAQIAREVPIDPAIVLQAKLAPLAPGTTEAVEAEGWHENELGRPTKAQRDAKAAAVAENFIAAARAFKKDPSPANRARVSAAYEAWKADYVAGYRDEPAEYDAFFLGEKVADKLGTPRAGFVSLDAAIEQIPEQ